MSQALSRKWRPARFEQVIGQEHVTRTLQNSVTGDRVSHAYLFCGPRGTGKTTMARLLAKAVNCWTTTRPPVRMIAAPTVSPSMKLAFWT
jgi:DNA polymerase III subunit gamma/tau